MAKDIIRVPIYQGDYHTDGTNPELNNLITEVTITGEHLPALLPEGSDVDITIKVDTSQKMYFSAYFPLLDHTEELTIEIKQETPPTQEELTSKIRKAKEAAKTVNADDIYENLESLENQLENEKGNADGKMKILSEFRKELLKLDNAEKRAKYPKVEKKLKDSFYDLEELVEQTKKENKIDNSVLERIERQINEYRDKIESIIKNRDVKEAEELIEQIGKSSFSIFYEVMGDELFVQHLKRINSDFASYHWKDPSKARQLINQGLQLASSGKTSSIV
jgi:molecular chaperone DnaK